MDFRNEYRTRASGYEALRVRLEYRKWWQPWRWRSLSIYRDDAEALKAAILHAEDSTPIDVKNLGRLP